MAFNVNSQAVGASSNSIGYLAPYVFKVAMSNSRIVKVENKSVYFRYKKPTDENDQYQFSKQTSEKKRSE